LDIEKKDEIRIRPSGSPVPTSATCIPLYLWMQNEIRALVTAIEIGPKKVQNAVRSISKKPPQAICTISIDGGN
jgi:hypothetical protein